jgi:FHS family glucose/mannose:H+ symporter-like MFS transporter
MEGTAPAKTKNRIYFSPNAIAHALFAPNGVVTVILGPLLPLLSARWSLNDTQAGYLVTAQFAGCLLATLASGEILPWLGFRWTMVIGLAFMTFGTATLMASTYAWAIFAVSANGVGIGLATPTTNLLVARTADRRASSLNLLNFFWSAGAMACPFLVAGFQSAQHVQLFLLLVACSVGVLMLALIATPLQLPTADTHPVQMGSRWQYLRTPTAVLLGTLFFVYIGTEVSFGLWLASYAKRVNDATGTWWATAPSYFYGALLVGRLAAPLALREISDTTLACMGATLACVGGAALIAVHSLLSIAFCAALIGFGLSTLYPIAIGFLSASFGAVASRIGGTLFAIATLGGAVIPWLVGFVSTYSGSLRIALLVPLLGCLAIVWFYWIPDLQKREAE